MVPGLHFLYILRVFTKHFYFWLQCAYKKTKCGSTTIFAYMYVVAVIVVNCMVYDVFLGWNPKIRTPFFCSVCNDVFDTWHN